MSGADIAGIVISVVAALVSLVALGYTVYSDCKNKNASKDAEDYKKKNDEEIRYLKSQLNDVIKEGLSKVSESISKLDKNKIQQDIVFETAISNNHSELVQKEEKNISAEKGFYNQKIKKVKKEQTERIRKNSIYKQLKK